MYYQRMEHKASYIWANLFNQAFQEIHIVRLKYLKSVRAGLKNVFSFTESLPWSRDYTVDYLELSRVWKWHLITR